MMTNNTIGLTNYEVASIISVLKKNNKITNVILFGSRAKGDFAPSSDVDLALCGNNLKLNDVLDASIEIENLNLPYKFDLIIYDRIAEPSLLDHIKRVGIALFEKA